MPFNELHITDKQHGLKSQPVPVRLIHLILGIAPHDAIIFLIDNTEETHLPVNIYEYRPGSYPGRVRRDDYVNILDAIPTKEPAQLISRIPPEHFVWSTDLANAANSQEAALKEMVDYPGNELILNWQPALGTYAELVQECSDFAEQQPNPEKKEKYKEWCRQRQVLIDSARKNLIKSDGTPNESEIAKQIAVDAHVTSDHIRKMIRKHCN